MGSVGSGLNYLVFIHNSHTEICVVEVIGYIITYYTPQPLRDMCGVGSMLYN